LAEGEAEVRDSQKQRVQRELLNLVFATYFRVLKTAGPMPKTLPIVLKGLAKYVRSFSLVMSICSVY
jgi:hypothetical protein